MELSETALPGCRRNGFVLMAMLALILMIYSNTFHASWQFDDESNILKNGAIHLSDPTWENIKKPFFASLDGKGKIYRPVACLSFAINYYFGGDHVLGYHVVNLGIHLLASLFLFLFIFNTLNLPILKAKYGANAYSIALFSSLLWAINPVQTQAVTYIVQRMTGMAGLFYIMSMHFYVKSRMSETQRQKALYFLTCILCAILAFGSKENTAMLPVTILLLDLFLIQGITRANIKRNLLLFSMLLLIPLILGLVLKGPSLFDSRHLFSGYDQRAFTWGERLLTEPRVILFYISLLLYPMPDRLSVIHDISLSHSLFDPPTTIMAILFIFFILLLAIMGSRRWPFISYCILFFFLNHVVESSILPLELAFEHRNYIPSMLFFPILTLLVLKGIQFFSYKRNMQRLFIAFVILILVGEGHSTFIRNAIWKTPEGLWIDSMEKYPELLRPYINLGKYYSETNQPHKAIIQFRLGLNKRDVNNIYDLTYWKNYYNIGIEYARMGEREEALSYFIQADRLFPNFPDLQNNIGSMLLGAGRYSEAEERLLKALRYQPDHAKALSNLGSLYLIKGDLTNAEAFLRRALEMDPHDPITLKTQVRLYMRAGRFGKALIQAKRLKAPNAASRLFNQLLMAEIYHASGSQSQLHGVMNEIMESVDSKTLERFLHQFTGRDAAVAFFPEKEVVFSLIGELCERKSRIYQDLGFYCDQKKGELAHGSSSP